MKKKRVLHIIAVSFSINYFFGKQFSYLKHKNNNQYFLGCSPSREFIELSKELEYTPLEVLITREISPLKDLKAILLVYKFIKKNKIDKVVGHTPKGGMIAMIASYLAGISCRIYFRHGIIYETSSGFKRFILKNIDRLSGSLATKVVCVSESIKDISERDRLNSPRKNVILGLGTCNGIDTMDKYNPFFYKEDLIAALKSKLNIKKEDFVVGFVGRLVKDKGINELIKAWDVVKELRSNVKLLLVGPMEVRDSISAYSRDKILNDPSIIFTDFVEDSAQYYSLMNVFILPSFREGFSTVSLEASSMEKPVLITNATGCSEAIKENITGLFITHEFRDIASKIIYYYDNREIAEFHGKGGRIFVNQNFEQTKIWDLIANELMI